VEPFRFREPSQRCKVSLHYRRAGSRRERERERELVLLFGGHAMHRPKKNMIRKSGRQAGEIPLAVSNKPFQPEVVSSRLPQRGKDDFPSPPPPPAERFRRRKSTRHDRSKRRRKDGRVSAPSRIRHVLGVILDNTCICTWRARGGPLPCVTAA
jgi:hypothetical protein